MHAYFVLMALVAGLLAQAQSGAKALFYSPHKGPPLAARPANTPDPRLPVIDRTRESTGWDHVGIHYWFEDDSGKRYSEQQASALASQLSLHIRNNTGGFLSVWDADKQLTPVIGRYNGLLMEPGSEYVVPGRFQFTASTPRRLIVVFGKSQTEQPDNVEHSKRRLVELTSWKLPDGQVEVIRETDDSTGSYAGTYVVSRAGDPVAAEIVLRLRSATSS